MSLAPHLFGKVAVLYGGTSAEREVSLQTGACVLEALKRRGVDAHGFDPKETPIIHLATSGFDRVFIALHGRGGEDGQIQGALEWFGLPYTGSGVQASALGMDKVKTKMVWLGHNLPTQKYHMVTPDTKAEDVVAALGLPFIIKPVHEGSSIGMSKVEKVEDFQAAIEKAAAHDAVVMAEKWITGREFTIVFLGDHILPIIRLQPPAEVAFYDYEAKYIRNDTQYGIPCGLTPTEEDALREVATKAFKAIGAEHYGRIDAMQDEEGNFWLLEVNTIPGMTTHSLLPLAASGVGIDFDSLALEMLRPTLNKK